MPAPRSFTYPGEAVERPEVFIPVFPGSNCDYDTAKAFRRAGAEVRSEVFCNLTAEAIFDSIRRMKEAIAACHIFVLCGGFSAGDEPDGDTKFIANVLNNARYFGGNTSSARPGRSDSGHLQRFPGAGQVGSAALRTAGPGDPGVADALPQRHQPSCVADRFDPRGDDQLPVVVEFLGGRHSFDRGEPRRGASSS